MVDRDGTDRRGPEISISLQPADWYAISKALETAADVLIDDGKADHLLRLAECIDLHIGGLSRLTDG